MPDETLRPVSGKGEGLSAWPFLLSGGLMLLAGLALVPVAIMALAAPDQTDEYRRAVLWWIASCSAVPVTWLWSFVRSQDERKRTPSRRSRIVVFGVLPFVAYLVPFLFGIVLSYLGC